MNMLMLNPVHRVHCKLFTRALQAPNVRKVSFYHW